MNKLLLVLCCSPAGQSKSQTTAEESGQYDQFTDIHDLIMN